MAFFRRALSAFLLVAMMGSISLAAYAAGAARCCDHGRQAASAHGCCKGPTMRACCADPSNPANPSGPAQGRTVFAPLHVMVPLVIAGAPPAGPLAVARAHASPPRGPSVDLPTLHATLLL